MRYLHIPLACLAGMLTALADPAPVNIAVISTPDTADLGALVTTELSSSQQVHLLERDDLAKIGDEAKVQQMAGSDSIALGRLVGADGLFFIDKEGGTLRIRFTAVSLGYALFDDQLGADLGLPQQAQAIAHRIVDYAPKLRLDPTKAVPLSVINLRADTNNTDTVALERPLTLLLESRLSFVPEYVVLERRHAWSLGFEHTLDASGKPLLHGAYLIDGTISHDNTGDNCTVHLRLRDPHSGQEKTANITGVTSDPASLANKILAEVERDIPHASPAPTSFDTAREADEYLHEALWGWHSNVPDSALEAVDSAELLGTPSQYVFPLRIQILCAIGDTGMSTWYPPFDQKIPSFDANTLDVKTSAMVRAIQDTVRYRDGKLEDQLGTFVPANSVERAYFRTGATIARVAAVSSKLLFLLDQGQGPRANELRQDLRTITGYDPLHGKPGAVETNLANNGNAADVFADDWAQNLDEELAWLRLTCVDSQQLLPRARIGDPSQTFCPRFLTTPDAREKGFDDFVESLKTNPDSQRTYFILKTHEKDPTVADEGYRQYVDFMWQHRQEIATSNDYTPLPDSVWYVDSRAIDRNPATALPLIHAVLDEPHPGLAGVSLLRILWRPADTAPQDAPAIWKEENAYVQRLNAERVQKEGRPDATVLAEMDSVMSYFKGKFANVVSAPLPDDSTQASGPHLPPLTVSQFWYPWLASDYPANGNPTFSGYIVGGDNIYVCSHRGPMVNGIIFEIHLPDFATRIIPTMDDAFVQNVLWTPQALYAPLGSEKTNVKHQLARYDFATHQWEKHALTVGFIQSEMFAVNGALYLGSAYGMSPTDEDCGLSKYDWDSDQALILASSRRRPAQNQFDDASPYRIDDVFAGPGGKPVVSTLRGAYYIQEAPGQWGLAMNGSFADETAADGDLTLVYNNNGEATLIDPKKPAPIPLMASDQPTYRVLDVNKGHADPEPTPWAAQAIFDCPPGKRKNMAGNTAYHDGHIYIFNQPDATRNEYELLYYDKARGRAPIHIPLNFHFNDTDRAAMAKHPGRLPNGWAIDELEHPHSPFEPHVLGTRQGLCLRLMIAGFWFIPYSDIESYMKTLPATPTP
jgi:hypothetical protein